MRTVYIYALIDPRTEEIRYIGYTNDIARRYEEHLRDTDNGSILYRHNWIRELLDQELIPDIKILEKCDEDTYIEREMYWKYYGDINGWPLTNLTDGGDGAFGYKFTEEASKHQSDAQLERYKDSNERKKTSYYIKEAYNINPKLREKASENSKGMWKDLELRKRQSEIQLKRWQDPEEIRKQSERFSGKNNPMFGYEWTEEQRKNKSEKMKGLNTGENNPNYGNHYTNNEETVEKKRQSQIERYKDPEQRRKTGEASKRMWEDPEIRKHILDSRIATKERNKKNKGNK